MQKQLKPSLYSVGVLNPNMRVFDVMMRTDYGTSYNSYIVTDKKTALIETCHHRFFEEYLENIESVIDPAKIDYIVLNHTEPDHSGALRLLKAACPNAEILCSRAAAIYLKNIVNDPSVSFRVVSDGESVSLGSLDLKFIYAPFLHWPDTMFTYCAGLATVFTCDFLGAHYCEPNMIDSRVVYRTRYEAAFQEYYDAIFAPFAPYVRAGLNKLAALDYDTVCVSHGPILTAGDFLVPALKRYEKWSIEPPKTALLLPVFYCSAYGYTKRLALTAVDTVKQIFPDAECRAYDIIENDLDDLARIMNASDGFLLGSPTINRDAVSPAHALLSRVDAINSQKKPAAVFGSYGWSGEAVSSLSGRLASLRLKPTGEGFRAVFAPSDTELDGMREFVKEFCKMLS
ncbi:MAG: FprA family A-type flavoprotein [Clostridiales bacterium]|jgi:flavorubredoxin|nr:FprA family A-type flavoprotein [Clostridiales bacterium]